VVKVLDFGLSRELGDRCDGAADDAQFIIGTPLYLSPEALARPEAVDARSDLYAVGALGYFLLTGTTPFAGGSLLEVCGHHLHTTPETPSARLGAAIPQKLEKLILSCLAKSPELRPASAAELRKALLGVAAAWTEERAARWWNEHDGQRGALDVSSLVTPPAPESQMRAIAA
jgi:serine/threonine-protein kinase